MKKFSVPSFFRRASGALKLRSGWTTILLLCIGVLSAGLGFVREIQIASLFGVSNEADFYFMGALVPEMLAGVIGNATANIFMRQYKTESKPNDYAASVMAVLCLLIITALVILELTFPYIARGIATGLSGEEFDRFVGVGRIMLAGMISSVFVGVLTGTLNMNGRFVLAGMNSLAYNLVLIATTHALVPLLDIQGLAWSYLLANAARIVLLYPFTRKYIGRWRLRPAWPLLKELPRISISNLVLSLQLVIERGMASSIGAGAVSALSYTGRICGLPSVLFVSSVLTVAFPKFIHEAENKQRLSEIILSTMKAILYCLIAIELFFVIYREDIVRILFLRGKFDLDSSRLVATLFIIYAPVVVLSAMNQVLLKVSYALGRTKLPFVSTLLSLPIYLGAVYGLKSPYGIYGLALGLLIYNAAIFVILFLGLRLSSQRLRVGFTASFLMGCILPPVGVCMLFVGFLQAPLQNVIEVGGMFMLFALAYTALLALADREVRSFIRQKANAVRLAGRRIEKHRL